MAKVIRVTDVDDDVHAALSAQAQAAGRSLNDHLRDQLARLSRGELKAQPAPPVASAPASRANGPETGADIVARLRGTELGRKR